MDNNTDNDADDNEGGYSSGDFSSSGPLPSEEEREEDEGCRAGRDDSLSRFVDVTTTLQRRGRPPRRRKRRTP